MSTAVSVATTEANRDIPRGRNEPVKGRVLFHDAGCMREQETEGFRPAYSRYFKQNVHLFDALDFLAELTHYIPPGGLQLVRCYGLYASRTKGLWEQMPWVAQRAPEAWKAAHQRDGVADDLEYEPLLSDGDEEVTVDARKCAWVRRFA